MATIKSSDQISIVDLTDGYSVILTSDGYTFPGGTSAAVAGSTTTGVIAMCGANQVNCSVDVSAIVEAGKTAKPAGVGTISISGNNGTNPVLTIPVTTSFTTNTALDIPVAILDDSGNAVVTIHKYFSMGISKTGTTPAAPYSALTGNDAQVITCDKDGKSMEATTVTIPYTVFQGTARKAANVRIGSASANAAANDAVSTGITVKSNTAGTTSAQGTLVLQVAAGSDLGGGTTGSVTLHVYTGSTLVADKTFTWSKSITGADGAQGPQGNPGNNGTNATNVIIGCEAVTIPCKKDGKVSAAAEIVIPFAGYIGTARAACTVSYSTLPSGITLKSGGNVAATTSKDGSLTFTVAANGTLGNVATGVITLTFTCNSQTFVRKFTWSKALTGADGAQGPQGNPGNDAITMTIISSAGTIFKNTSVVTTLTAHVYKGGVEVTGTDLTALGTIKWYKDGSSSAVGTGPTLSVGTGDVTNKATYIAQLETE